MTLDSRFNPAYRVRLSGQGPDAPAGIRPASANGPNRGRNGDLPPIRDRVSLSGEARRLAAENDRLSPTAASSASSPAISSKQARRTLAARGVLPADDAAPEKPVRTRISVRI
ncbi:hypothetical protein [Geothermobacter ehrlichii]|uniref:hypothetical protein n=1 Tax=Geothermobacter ehrlichii TaxID=213224 RepID=UPI0011E83AE2|nr:hypothetical protein [Geothermobacter ehrlichii]